MRHFGVYQGSLRLGEQGITYQRENCLRNSWNLGCEKQNVDNNLQTLVVLTTSYQVQMMTSTVYSLRTCDTLNPIIRINRDTSCTHRLLYNDSQPVTQYNSYHSYSGESNCLTQNILKTVEGITIIYSSK